MARRHCGTELLIPAAEPPQQLPSAPDFHLPLHLHLQDLNFSWEMKGIYSRIAIQLTGALVHSLAPFPMYLPFWGPANNVSLGLILPLCR